MILAAALIPEAGADGTPPEKPEQGAARTVVGAIRWDGLKWNAAHPEAAEANALLIYAWNENDEGGWLVPTLGEGSARLDAIREVLR